VAEAIDMMKASMTPLHIAVVGHTNTGKTSLLRTLTRDQDFGAVKDAPGTTRQVQSAVAMLDHKVALTWYDTPGLEDSVALRDWIDGLPEQRDRLEGADRIDLFLADQQARLQFEQEYRVLAQVMRCDALLYVIDARDPVMAKHRDELYILQACARPVLPVLNFVASPDADIEPWTHTFARHAMHIYLAFDSVSPPIHGQQMMYDTLGQLLGQHRTTLNGLAQQAVNARRERIMAAVGLLADVCVEVASVHTVSKNDASHIEQAIIQQQNQVRALEEQFVDRILTLYQFSSQDYLPPTQGWVDGQWSTDLFSARTLTDLGIDLGKGAAIGAAAGAAVDIMSAGLTLGTGTLIGAAAGSAWQGVGRWGKDLKSKLAGERTLQVSDNVLIALATRNIRLIAALEQRGHASQTPVRMAQSIGSGDEFEYAAFIASLTPTREDSLQWLVTKRLGLGWRSTSAKDDIKEILLRAQCLEPLCSDGLH